MAYIIADKLDITPFLSACRACRIYWNNSIYFHYISVAVFNKKFDKVG